MFRVVLLLSIALFGWSLFLPVYADKPDLPGYLALLGGWMVGLNDIPTAVSWLANVMYILAFVMILKRKNPKPRAAFVYGILAVLLGAAVLGAGKAFVGYSETVGKLSLGMAFYAWMGSFILMCVAAWLKMKQPAANGVSAANEELVDRA